MNKIAVFTGSFDPITKGHQDIILRAQNLFDTIIIAIGENSNKTTMFSLEQRTAWIKHVFASNTTIQVKSYTGLTVDFCKQVHATYILRGVRSVTDLEFERTISQMNKQLMPHIETVFLITSPETSGVSSTVVRDIIRNNGDASAFLPQGISVK